MKHFEEELLKDGWTPPPAGDKDAEVAQEQGNFWRAPTPRAREAMSPGVEDV
jgi:hypothetical protein